MERNARNYLKLFLSTFYLSAFTFGGGYVIIPLMKKKFVDDLAWLEEEEMLNMAAIAQSSPGAMAVNAAILVGYNVLGPVGALVAVLGTVLPPLILLSLISLIYVQFRSNQVVAAVLKGMMAGVCAMIMDVVITMGGKIIKGGKWLPIAIMAGAFLVNLLTNINVVYIIIFCAVLGAVVSSHDRKTGKEHL